MTGLVAEAMDYNPDRNCTSIPSPAVIIIMVPDSQNIAKPQLFDHDLIFSCQFAWISAKNQDLSSYRLTWR